jgi:hypothetical protein
MREPKSGLALLGAWPLALLAVSFVVSLSASRWYWGYFFMRPPVLGHVHRIQTVTAVVPFETQIDHSGHPLAVPNPNYDLGRDLNEFPDDPYYDLTGRVIKALKPKGNLGLVLNDHLDVFPVVYEELARAGLLAESAQGYNSIKGLRGVMIEGTDADGKKILVVAASGGEVSNDHYPFYEATFSSEAGSTDLTWTGGQRFFYDIAGIEGLEWYGVWLFLATFSLPVAGAFALAHLAVLSLARRSNARS